MANAFDNFASQVRAAGLVPMDRKNGHWQIVGGPLLVNYYPSKGTIYVAGTTGKIHGNVSAAITAAGTVPKMLPKSQQDKRRNQRKHKLRLLTVNPHCFWCGTPLTAETGTIDHRIPLSRGGLDNANNRVLACEPCNKARGHSMPEISVTVTISGQNHK